MPPQWLEWAKRLQAIAQNGLTYAHDPFDIERYEATRRIAAEIVAAHSDIDLNSVSDLFANEKGPATPKVDMRAAVFRDDAILLVKERSDGLWSLPGGWADVNESPAKAIEREVYEESGYRTCAVKLLAFSATSTGIRPMRFMSTSSFSCANWWAAPRCRVSRQRRPPFSARMSYQNSRSRA